MCECLCICLCVCAAGSAGTGGSGSLTLSDPDSLIANAFTFHPCVCGWHFLTLGVVFTRGWGGGGKWFVVAKLSG